MNIMPSWCIVETSCCRFKLSAMVGGPQVMFAAVFALSVNLLKLILFEIMDLMSVRCAMRDGLDKLCIAHG